MRRILFTASALAALALTPGLAAAQGPGAIRVQASTLGTNFPVTGLSTSVTPCSGGSAVAAATTGANGTGTASVPFGCYRVKVTAVPSGCSLDGKPTVQVVALPGMSPQAAFHVRCA
ncbi:prealbumin-like fold domain-containing protein [Nocardia miyunensis]|uniref:prealbumin-like fold domain-containing protein n=1 Tax=Nocardia miyunensis TaxID=282684 RepID=UPI000836B099|nr:prealbumin-like fold domain-containing protein [Nocardia miyunensis]